MVQLPPPSPSVNAEDHIFVSYASKDRAFVMKLVEKLRARGHTVWIDFERIQGGRGWKQSIADALHPSQVILLILSPDSITSQWVEEEVRTARELKKLIIPILLRPIDQTINHENIAYFHSEVHYRNFTEDFQHAFEELLKDLPKPETGIAGHCKKLIARLAKAPWGLDHYIQEEAKLLPLNASPYEDGMVQGYSENLMTRLWNSHRVIVLGEPGVGKSVALERLAWELASSEPPTVPIIIKLLEYDGKPLLDWIRLHLRELGEINLKSEKELKAFLDNPDHTCYFLLDGLNEVRIKHREALGNELVRLALDYPKHHVVITSRVQDDGWRLLRRGSAFQDTFLVQPIQPKQVQRYLIAHLGREDARRLWRGLDKRMRGLASTPLLLWLIKEAWEQAKQIQGDNARIRVPDNRGDLYRNFVDRLLQRDQERKIVQTISEQAQLEALEKLALHLHSEQALNFTRDSVRDVLNDDDILNTLLKNGLLIGETELRFAPHQTMQEHFAARALLNEVEIEMNKRGLTKVFRRMGFGRGVLQFAGDPWWAETFIQLAGLTDDPNTLAQAIAEVNPWLAWWCVKEGKKVDKATRRTVRKRSMALVVSPDVTDRRNAAQTLVNLGIERSIDYLAKLSVDIDPETAIIACSALMSDGETGITAFLNEVYSKSRQEQIAIWQRIAEVDVRPGVGLRLGNLPDILWGKTVHSGLYAIGGDMHAFQGTKSREVSIPYDYKLAQFPVSNMQFRAFMDAEDGIINSRWWTNLPVKQSISDEPRFRFANHPRDNVTWYEAVTFCRWLTHHYRLQGLLDKNLVIRLPSESEWEVASRYPDGRIYAWGDEFNGNQMNIIKSVELTSAVGMFPDGKQPHLELYDLNGNVWEWTLTSWDTGENNNAEPMGRVIRGGSWYNPANYARSASRIRAYPTKTLPYIGFRVVMAPPIEDIT